SSLVAVAMRKTGRSAPIGSPARAAVAAMTRATMRQRARGPVDVRNAQDARRCAAGRPGGRAVVNAGPACSDALENLRASSRDHPTIRPSGLRNPSYGSGVRADGSSAPDHGSGAIRRPRIRRREIGSTLSPTNVTGHIVANPRTCAGRASDEYAAEISSSGVDVQDLHDGAPLTLPNCGSPTLRRGRGGGCENKGQSDHAAVHVFRLQFVAQYVLDPVRGAGPRNV